MCVYVCVGLWCVCMHACVSTFVSVCVYLYARVFVVNGMVCASYQFFLASVPRCFVTIFGFFHYTLFMIDVFLIYLSYIVNLLGALHIA